MNVTAHEVQFLAFLMSTAYAVMAIEAFAPNIRAHRAAGGAVRSSRRPPEVVEWLWVSTQGVTILGLAAAFFVPAVLTSSPTNLLSRWPLALSVGGAFLFIAGVALVGSAAVHLGAQLAVAIELREGGKLVTSGPYRHIRHPIYTGVFAMVAGLAFAIGSPLVALYLPVAVYCGNYRARLEEELLSTVEGVREEYASYLKRTGRFLPWRSGSDHKKS